MMIAKWRRLDIARSLARILAFALFLAAAGSRSLVKPTQRRIDNP
jgi:hypothetical protein